jgi:predicted ATP-grasp superfamily ATP-dependent carboligase
MPDLEAVRSLLKVLLRFLKVDVDLSGLDKEAEKINRFAKRLEVVEAKMRRREEALREAERLKTTYIS